MSRNTKMNAREVSDLDMDNLLPPRKRLLAGFKRQKSDVNFPIPSTSSSAGSEFNAHLNHLLRSQLSNPNKTNEEIIEASRRAAIEAAKVAETARANAEDRAAKAAKAVAAAKRALELVATLSEEALVKENRLKKNKLKKHIPVESLYSKNKEKTNCRMDEELARHLHRSINSSSRISKSVPCSDVKTHKHKRLKSSVPSEKTRNHGGVIVGEGIGPSVATRKGNDLLENISTESLVRETGMIMVDLNASKSGKVGQVTLSYGEEANPSETDRTMLEHEVEALYSKDKVIDSFDCLDKRRGRIKQKKLPLSICSLRDKTGRKEQRIPKDSPRSEDNLSRTAAGNRPSFLDSLIPPMESASVWKCQAFKARACVGQNKVMQS